MRPWRELADEVRRGEATTTPKAPAPVPSLALVPGLPGGVVAGMATLRTMPTPRIKERARWRGVVDDAERLVAGGWAAQALALGWHPLELFGFGLNKDDRYDGLAVWLTGRRIVLLDDASVIVRDGDWRRCFNRQRVFLDGGDGDGLALPLWRMGKS